MKKLILLAAGALLWACGGDSSSEVYKIEPVGGVQVLLNGKKGFSKDSVIYLADSVKFVDKLNQSADFGKEDHPKLVYSAKALASAIDIELQTLLNDDDGSIVVSCHPSHDRKIYFNEPVFPATQDGYTLTMEDSLKVGDSMYYDVLKFDASKNDSNFCSVSAFYYGIHDGLVKVVSKNGVELNRVSAKVYKDAEKRREKERAIADSIAQAVADSIAQAVADSILKANTAAQEGDDDDPQIEIPQDVQDLVDSIAECIKRAYSSGSLSALKECGI